MTVEMFGHYALDGTLGRGAFATVYRATDTRTGSMVALKILDRTADPDALRRQLHNEAAALQQIDDEHCARVLDVLADTTPAIATEYIHGAPLRAVLTRAGTLTGPQALDVMRGALLGLAAVHRAGLLHGDVKPDNILVDRAGVSRLIDFGLTRAAGIAPTHDAVTGSPAYMSPEQASGGSTDRRSDLYSCATVLFELLTGARPFPGATTTEVLRSHLHVPPPDPRSLHPELTEQLASVCTTGMAKNPDDRYQSADDFLDALSDAARRSYGGAWAAGTGLGALVGAVIDTQLTAPDTPSTTSNQPPTAAPRHNPRQRRLMIGAAAGACLLIAAALIAILATRHPHPHPQAAANPITTSTSTSVPPGGSRPGGVLNAATSRFQQPAAIEQDSYYSASCPTAQTCLATGQTTAQHPILSVTTDGGTHWTTTPLAVPATLGLLSCSDPRTCVAGYFDTAVHMTRTTDGGTTWQPAQTPAVTNLQSISCPTPTSCLAVGGSQPNGSGTAQAISTHDDGRTWQRVPIPGPANSVSCPDISHCWAAGSATKVWATTNLGASWHAVSPPGTFPPTPQAVGPYPANTVFPINGRIGNLGFYLGGVAFSSDTDGIAFGGALCGGYKVTKCASGVYRTTDAAKTWTFWPPTYTDAYGNGAYATCINHACLMVTDTFTNSVLISTTDSHTWQTRQTFPSFAGRTTCSTDAATCIVIGHTGLWIAHQ